MNRRVRSQLRYTSGLRSNGTARAHYLHWRTQQQPPIPERCDNPLCTFFHNPLEWNGNRLPLILEHINGVNSDNRVSNLRLLCPNCDSQNSATRGGANRGRVIKSAGGFCLVNADGHRAYVLPAEPVTFGLIVHDVALTGARGLPTCVRVERGVRG